MSADLLEKAADALRNTTRSGTAELEQGLQRIERSRAPNRTARRHLRSVTWALGLTFLGAGAWASATGRIPWANAPAVTPANPAPPEPAPAAPARSARREELSPAADPVVPAPTAAPSLEPVEPTTPAPRAKLPAAPPPVPHEPPRRELLPAHEDADALYRTAHTAHFAGSDSAAALAAWDRYLAVAPPGHRFRLEARYNRGITLYRLGQREAAHEALQPFADGEYGGYRREAARRLLDELSR